VETVARHPAGVTSIDLATFVLFSADTFDAFAGAPHAPQDG